MSLHDELLDAARFLIRRNQGRPTQGDLRRSISSAYYALFHRLIADGTSLAVGATEPDALGRAFGHTDMKKACQIVLKSPLPPQVTPLLGNTVPQELQNVAEVFIELQDLRHEADYNRRAQFDKSDAREAIVSAEAAFRDWDRVRSAPVAHVFLVLLLLGERLNRG
jgi:uncharacterized protein (UPF0332 family)